MPMRVSSASSISIRSARAATSGSATAARICERCASPNQPPSCRAWPSTRCSWGASSPRARSAPAKRSGSDSARTAASTCSSVNTALILGPQGVQDLRGRADVSCVGRAVSSLPVTGPAARVGWRDLESELMHVLEERQIEPVFQPLVDLDTGRVVAYEALARGPRGGALESPAALFAVAREADMLGELDCVCRASAVRTAVAAGLPEGTGLFVNIEPDALATPCPVDLAADLEPPPGLQPFVEITERALTAQPAELLGEIARLRERGWGVALDDVGADTRSLALMPLLQPDVIKLDLRLVQEQPTTEVAEIVNGVLAERERSGATILAEGIENDAHLDTARALGAQLGQGWLLGR